LAAVMSTSAGAEASTPRSTAGAPPLLPQWAPAATSEARPRRRRASRWAGMRVWLLTPYRSGTTVAHFWTGTRPGQPQKRRRVARQPSWAGPQYRDALEDAERCGHQGVALAARLRGALRRGGRGRRLRPGAAVAPPRGQ